MRLSFGPDIRFGAPMSNVEAKVQDRQAAGQSGGSMRLRSIAAAFGLLWLGFAGSAEAAKTHVAVAANFTEPARKIAALFREKTGHEAVLIFGASGAFFTQITHDAPFEVFLPPTRSGRGLR